MAAQWLEEKYIHLLGSSLGHFHKQSRNIFTFRCVFCGDSQKRQNKTRGYLFLYQRQYFYKCHNCGESMSLRTFLKRMNPELFREYQLDILRNERPTDEPLKTPTLKSDTMFWSRKPTPLHIPRITALPDDHIAVRYCRNRELPETALSHLYFTEHWVAWLRTLGWSYGKLEEDGAPRLVIPWFSRQGELLGAQCRRIDVSGKDSRYVTLKADATEDKVYGWERVDYHQRIYLVEGPLDSWFLPNAMAAMGSDLLSVHHRYLNKHNVVLIWDNEPRNREIVTHLGRAVRGGLPVVIWPDGMDDKDINDMARNGHDILSLVQQHTYQGLRAELEYLRWRR